jgi:hypothetical protein
VGSKTCPNVGRQSLIMEEKFIDCLIICVKINYLEALKTARTYAPTQYICTYTLHSIINHEICKMKRWINKVQRNELRLFSSKALHVSGVHSYLSNKWN